MSEPVLKVSNLQVELGGQKILHDLSFDLQERETLVVLGPNGAGKTVLPPESISEAKTRSTPFYTR